MWALQAPIEVTSGPGWRDARVLLGACLAAGAVAATGVLPPEAAAVAAVAAVHGGLIAAALLSMGVSVTEAAIPIALLAFARVVVAVHPLGAIAYLAIPLWLAHLVRVGVLRSAGLGRPWPWRAIVVAALGGAALALHLFACASRTLGYGIHVLPAIVLPALAYDLGANVISAELFFRGELLSSAWRRQSFALALALATAATAVRYCADPFVATTELRLGAAVYMTLLAILNGLLYRWAGSVLPGLTASTVFFVAYRLIGRG